LRKLSFLSWVFSFKYPKLYSIEQQILLLFMQKIFPCLDIKKILSPSLNVQQETIFSDGKSFAMINPWDCLEVGVKNLFDKLNFKKLIYIFYLQIIQNLIFWFSKRKQALI